LSPSIASIVSTNIRQRRTVKPSKMSDRPLARELLLGLLEDANWAPTHGMTEPWRFVVFTGDARVKLGEFLSETYRQVTPADAFKQKKCDSLRVNPTLAPVVLAIGMKRQMSGKIPEVEEIEAVACAVQNLHLSAAAHGIGGFWSSNAAACSDAMRQYLALDASDRVLGLFYLGYPAGDWPTSERTPIADKVRWVS